MVQKSPCFLGMQGKLLHWLYTLVVIFLHPLEWTKASSYTI